MTNSTLRYIATGSISEYEVAVDARDGTAEVTWQYQGQNATTFAHVNGHIYTLALQDPQAAPEPDVDAVALDAVLESDAARVLLARVAAGYDSDWNGSNYIGSLDEDAEAALAELQALVYSCDRLPEGAGAWEAAEWLGEAKADILRDAGITASTSDADLERHAEALIAEAEGNDVVLEERDVLNLLRDWRDELDEADDDEALAVGGAVVWLKAPADQREGSDYEQGLWQPREAVVVRGYLGKYDLIREF